MKKITQILLYIWQLPQNILGLMLFWWYEYHSAYTRRDTHKGINYLMADAMKGGISLGNYVILSYYYTFYVNWKDREAVNHEWGHTRQSRMLGPLYLFVIGIPSILHAAVHSRWCKQKSYYHFWTEKWADKLGGVKR